MSYRCTPGDLVCLASSFWLPGLLEGSGAPSVSSGPCVGGTPSSPFFFNFAPCTSLQCSRNAFLVLNVYLQPLHSLLFLSWISFIVGPLVSSSQPASRTFCRWTEELVRLARFLLSRPRSRPRSRSRSRSLPKHSLDLVGVGGSSTSELCTLCVRAHPTAFLVACCGASRVRDYRHCPRGSLALLGPGHKPACSHPHPPLRSVFLGRDRGRAPWSRHSCSGWALSSRGQGQGSFSHGSGGPGASGGARCCGVWMS